MAEAPRMERIFATWPFRTERRQDVTLVLLWGVSIATVLAQAFLQRATATIFDLAILFVICVAAGAITQDFTKALFSYAASMIIGLALLFLFLMLPILTGAVSGLGAEDLAVLWISILIQQLFPIPILAFFMASMIGVGLAEHYWY
jgi:hypothetical protein